MTRRGILMLAGAGALAFGIYGCGALFPARYRFRMTVEVQTPQGVKSGSSVYEVSAYKNESPISLPEESAREWEVKGQALMLDLPNGTVFALMQTGAGGDLAQMSMAALDPRFHNDIVESTKRIGGSWSTLNGEVAKVDWPLLVRFRNINDPKSVEQVNPDAIGVKRVRVETTRDPVATGIEKHLKWLSDPGLTLDPTGRPTINPTLPQALRQSLFWQSLK